MVLHNAVLGQYFVYLFSQAAYVGKASHELHIPRGEYHCRFCVTATVHERLPDFNDTTCIAKSNMVFTVLSYGVDVRKILGEAS